MDEYMTARIYRLQGLSKLVVLQKDVYMEDKILNLVCLNLHVNRLGTSKLIVACWRW